jgi:hypothetical protein
MTQHVGMGMLQYESWNELCLANNVKNSQWFCDHGVFACHMSVCVCFKHKVDIQLMVSKISATNLMTEN